VSFSLRFSSLTQLSRRKNSNDRVILELISFITHPKTPSHAKAKTISNHSPETERQKNKSTRSCSSCLPHFSHSSSDSYTYEATLRPTSDIHNYISHHN
jgi:hypothetical protein